MAASAISLNFLPPPLRKALLNFQKEGVQFGISKQGRCLIGDEMGLGKTLQAISIAYYYKDAWPLLIVVPSSVKFSWIDEIEKWLPEVEPQNLNLIRSGSDISNLGKALIHIIGYGLLSVGTSKLLLQALESHNFNVVILDESHYLKTKSAARTKRLHQLCKQAKHAILLSGTPSLARPRELYFQLDIVCPRKFGSFSSFVKRYCDAHHVYYRGERHYDTSGASNLNELFYLLKTHVMIRRLKKEVLTQLPPKRRQKVIFDICESPSKYKKELQQILKDFKKCSAILKGDADDPSIQSPLLEMNRLSTLLYHYTGLVKIGPVLKYIEDLAQGMDSKFIVFFRHRLVRQAIVQKLVTLKLKHICIAGDVPSGIRGDLVQSFQTDPQVRIAVLSIEAASFGLTLTAAHHVVFAELHHTPGVIIQAEDRAHRIGQTLPVNVHYLIARGTVDEILWSMIRRKVYVTSSTLDGECKELNAEDGDEDQSRQLSACAAWVQDQEEDADELEDFVMAQLSSKTVKQHHSQRDLRSFFIPKSSSRTKQKQEEISDKGEVMQGESVTSVEPIHVLDIDDGADLSVWNDVDDDTLLSVSLEVPEDGTADERTSPIPKENVQNVNNAEIKLDEGKEHCPLKPKMLKFKKEKDGKLSFTRSKSYANVHNKESSCKTALKFVGDDPETESQTLQSYLYDEIEPVTIKTDWKEDCGDKAVCSNGNSSEKDRGFLASLQEADIECVAVICNKASSITTAESKKKFLSIDRALKVNNQGESDGNNSGKFEGRQYPSGEETVKADTCDLQENPETIIPNASSFSDPSYKLQSEQEKLRESSEAICSKQSECLTETCHQLDVNSVSVQVANGQKDGHPNGNQTEELLVKEDSTLHQSTNALGLDTVTSPSKTRSCTSCEYEFTHEENKTFIKESLEGKTENNSLNRSSNLSKCQQHLNKNASNSIDEGEVGEVTRIDEADSSDDFQASSIKLTQSAVSVAQKPSKAKKRKAAKKKVNKRTATNENRSHKNGKQPPYWSCSACTFINDGQLLECSICLTQRVKTDHNSRITNDVDIENSITKGYNVEVLEATGLSMVDSKRIDSVGANGGSSKETNGSSNRTAGSDRIEILRESTAVHDLSNVAKDSSQDKETCTFAEGGAVDDSGLPSWSCSVCTFYNMSLMIECSMCLTPRRRSQRKSTSRYTQEVQRRASDNINSSRKRRRKRDSAKRDGSPPDNSTCGDDTSTRNSRAIYGVDSRLAGKVLTPEAMESSYCDSDSDQNNTNNTSVDDIVISNDDCKIIKSRPRKRLRLGECNDVTEDVIAICDSSYDSQSVGNINPSVCTSSVLQSTVQKGPIVEIPSDGNCVSVRVDKMEKSLLKIENSERSKDDHSELCDFTDLSDHSVNMVDGERPSTESSSEIVADDSISCLHEQTSNKVMENLEELKAAAEEMFMSDSEDWWWEEESSSGQSSCPSSSDTASSSPAGTPLYTGFTKCSNLYSLSELKNKLQSTPEQPKANTTIKPSELDNDHEMSPATVQQESNVVVCAPAVKEEEFEEPDEDIPEPMKLKFCLSLYTERVYLYNEDDKPLGINFCMSDVMNGNVEDLPTILQDDYNLRQVKRLLEAWKRMGEGKKRVLRKSALVFDDPLGAYEQARKGLTRESSYVRHPSQETRIKKVIDTAAGVGGSIRVVKKTRITTKKKNNGIEHDKNKNNGQSSPTSTYSTLESSSNSGAGEDKSCYQAVNADGIPLCLFCSGAVEFADRLKCSDWEKRFCSHDCKKEYQVRVSGTAARRALFEAERGVCQLCSLDTHSLFLNITALHVRDRPEYLAQTPYASLPQLTLKRMVMEPKEGMFWEADHVTPVSEGGGECGLDNYRTLCVMCHRKETDELNRRLKQRKVLQYAAGYADITTFFGPRN